MRAFILLAVAFAASAADGPNFYVARGFVAGHCFRHPAIRRCKAEGPEPLCTLELFSSRGGALSMPLGEKDAPLIKGKATTDYGIFRFEIASYDSRQRPVVRVVDIEDVSLRRWDSVQDDASLARVVDCGR